MWLDVSELYRFYHAPLGVTARRLIRNRIRAMWPDTTGKQVMAVGYGAPYLRPFLGEAERTFALMPDRQGVIRWPGDARCLVALTDEANLPLADKSVDRILLIHAIEFSEQLRPFLREIWRVLADGGRVLAVVPNRSGVWARLERTPFGHGRPFSQGQLDRLLRDAMFLPGPAATTLYMPPSRRRFMLRFAPAVERLGQRWGLPFFGVLMVEAEKQVYASTESRRRLSWRQSVLSPARAPTGPAHPRAAGKSKTAGTTDAR